MDNYASDVLWTMEMRLKLVIYLFIDDKQFYKFVKLFVARLLILCPLFSITDIVL